MAKKTKKSGRKPSAAFMKPMQPSAALGEVVGSKPLPRTEVTKKLWAYIKKNKLQDQTNKRMVNADDKLRTLLGTSPTRNSLFLISFGTPTSMNSSCRKAVSARDCGRAPHASPRGCADPLADAERGAAGEPERQPGELHAALDAASGHVGPPVRRRLALVVILRQ